MPTYLPIVDLSNYGKMFYNTQFADWFFWCIHSFAKDRERKDLFIFGRTRTSGSFLQLITTKKMYQEWKKARGGKMITVRMSLESGDASGLLVTERTLMWLFWLKQIRTATIEGTMQGHNGPTAVSKTRPFSSTYLERKMVKNSHVTCKIQSECFILA